MSFVGIAKKYAFANFPANFAVGAQGAALSNACAHCHGGALADGRRPLDYGSLFHSRPLADVDRAFFRIQDRAEQRGSRFHKNAFRHFFHALSPGDGHAFSPSRFSHEIAPYFFVNCAGKYRSVFPGFLSCRQKPSIGRFPPGAPSRPPGIWAVGFRFARPVSPALGRGSRRGRRSFSALRRE